MSRRSDRRAAAPSWAAGLRRRIALARGALLWERLWYLGWPLVGVIGLFVAVSLLGLWSVLPRFLHIVLGVGFALGALAALVDAARRFRMPDQAEIERRIELENRLPHRPLGTLGDRPAGPTDAAGGALWRAHRARAIQAVQHLRLVRPRPGLIGRDPWALRHALILLLVVGLVVGWAEPLPRLVEGLSLPRSAVSATPPEIQAWIRPPAYTDTPPRFLTPTQQDGSQAHRRDTDAIWVPVGSILSVRMGGHGRAPNLVVREKRESRSIAFDQPAPDSFALSYKLNTNQSLTVRQGGETVAEWPIRVVPDRPPVIEFSAPVAQTERFSLAVPYLAEDDYGVVSAQIEIRPRHPVPGDAGNAKLDLPISLPGARARHVQATSYHDLTASLWAGLPVSLQLFARDAAGQTASSKPVDTVLPERVFHQPLAKAIVEQRKALAADPAAMPRVAEALDALTFMPKRFFTDRVLYLGMRSVYWRLKRAQAGHVPHDVYATLWALALRAEDGELSLAERALRDAEQRMRNALDKKGAAPQDFDALSRQLQEALDRFIDALAKKSQREAEQGADTSRQQQPNDRETSRQDLHDLIDRAGKLGQLGEKDAARELLSQLEAMIQNMRTGQPGQSQADRQRERALRDLSQMMDKQQDLLDKSFRQSQGNPLPSDQQKADDGAKREDNRGGNEASRSNQASPQSGGRVPGRLDGGGPGQGAGPTGRTPTDRPSSGAQAEAKDPSDAPGPGGAAQEQERLRRQLGDLMDRLNADGSAPGPLGRAEQSMRDAREALKRGAPGEALDPQHDALDQLERGAQALSRQMSNNRLSSGGNGLNDVGRDPLGRPGPTSGPDYGLGVEVPNGMQIERARRILQEIERRASERSRPEDELDYLDRLLRRF
jgi:uncharacterized protein (TIGR02302 family)